MSAPLTLTKPKRIVYPDSDGKPMADNTKQFRYIVMIEGGVDALFRDDPNVFVAGDLLWYPVEGHPEICTAPDTLVVFGRPKGDRGSYKQWEEGDIAPHVVFEVWSPSNRPPDLTRKLQFYDRYGVEEFYFYDPETGELTGWRRAGASLEEIPIMKGWISPRLGLRLELEDGELVIYRPDGERFLTFIELHEQRDAAAKQAAREAQRTAAAEAEVARLRTILDQQASAGPARP
jgi:Uma2 family endonuclease